MFVIPTSNRRTADEDFDILLEAGVMYDRRVAALLGELDDVAGEAAAAAAAASAAAEAPEEGSEKGSGSTGPLTVQVGVYGRGGVGVRGGSSWNGHHHGRGGRASRSRRSMTGDRYPNLVIIVTGDGWSEEFEGLCLLVARRFPWL